VLKAMRDLFASDVDEVVVDSEPVFLRVKEFLEKLMPAFTDRVKHHNATTPIFHSYGLEKELESLYQSRIELKNGGSIVVEQTEALVAIDVNSGKFKPGIDLEETAYSTNQESIPEIVRQLRLRDLGGVIIIDFIDMIDESHRRSVERRFREALREDRARIKIGRISVFGMLEMTRQRVGPGLKRTVFTTCPTCKGTSLVRSIQSKALAVLRELRAIIHLPGYQQIEVYTHQEVSWYLVNRKRRELLDLEERYGRTIVLKGEPTYPIDVVHYRFLAPGGVEVKVAIPAGLGVKP
jgi:ribonuclease E